MNYDKKISNRLGILFQGREGTYTLSIPNKEVRIGYIQGQLPAYLRKR